MLLEKRGKKVITLTAETPESTKKLIYNLFQEEEHDKWDVLIFSPTLTVGVSNLNSVNYHFHYDGSMSADVVSSIQMIKRTRKTREIHMFVREKINYNKTNYDDIRDDYISNVGKNQESYLFDLDDYGETRLSEIGKKIIKIDTFRNILEFNHKKAMFWLLKYHFLKDPKIVDASFKGNILHKYSKLIRDNKKKSIETNVNQFLEMNSIDKEELSEIEADKMMKVLLSIQDEITDCPVQIKTRILNCSLRDNDFLSKAKYFKAAFNFTKQIWDESDIKHLVSKAVTRGSHDDLHFYNVLLDYGQKEIFDEYLPKNLNANKALKYITEKCGYKLTKQNDPGVVGHRGYVVNSDIKELYGYVK